jgi:hypothetical protein
MEAHTPAEALLERIEHRLFKKPLWPYLRGVHPLVILTSPIIYLCAIPLFALVQLTIANCPSSLGSVAMVQRWAVSSSPSGNRKHCPAEKITLR